MKLALPLIAVLLALSEVSCRASLRSPDLGGIYNRAARHHDARRNPVIVIPGILGSKLRQEGTGRVVWGAFAGDYADPRTVEGLQLTSLPVREGAALAELTDDVVPNGVLDKVKLALLGLPIEQQAYVAILRSLGVGGYRDEQLGLSAIDYGDQHFTCFQFSYDWRRDNVENARRLHEFILEKRRYVQGEIERRFGVTDRDVKFDIVAHSMGGLIARYYLQYGPHDLPADGSVPPVTWEGAQLVDRVVLVGTPSAGSAHALVQLVEGFQPASILPRYPAALLCTYPAIYQLLPRTRHAPLLEATGAKRTIACDLYDAALWQRMGWGMASPAADATLQALLPEVDDPARRRHLALDHQRKCLQRARQFAAAMDVPARRPGATPSLYLMAGDAVPTAAVLGVDPATGALSILEEQPGDGTVLRSSALLDERVGGEWLPAVATPIDWNHATFLFTDHLGLTRDPAFTDNVLYLLLEAPR